MSFGTMAMPPAFKASKARRASRSRSKTVKLEILRAWLVETQSLRLIRHPEVRAKRASKDARPGPVVLRGSLRGYLRMTGYTQRKDAASSFEPGNLVSRSICASVAAISFATTLLRCATGLSR